MKIIIGGFEVEGTPEEVAALIRAHDGNGGPSVPRGTEVPSAEATQADCGGFASEKIAYRALRRRPLSPAQRALFKALLKAYPGSLTSSELQAATKYSANQLGGLLGAIGRRLSTTEGYVPETTLIEWMWDADNTEYSYRLPSPVEKALRRIDL